MLILYVISCYFLELQTTSFWLFKYEFTSKTEKGNYTKVAYFLTKIKRKLQTKVFCFKEFVYLETLS